MYHEAACECGTALPIPRSPCQLCCGARECRLRRRRGVEKARRRNERARHIAQGLIIPRKLLSPEQVRAIRSLQGTMGPTAAGRAHGARKWTVCEIWAGRAYAHVE